MHKFATLALILSLFVLPAFAQSPAPPSLGSLTLDLNVDESTQVVSEWKTWGSRLNELIDNRFETLAKAKFKSRPALSAEVLFSVTKDGFISGAEMSKGSTNVAFNMLTLDSIKSLSGNSQLAFPQGSNKLVMSVHKVFNLKPGSDFSDVVPGKRVGALYTPRCCSGAAVFSSEKEVHEFLQGNSTTLCGYDEFNGLAK